MKKKSIIKIIILIVSFINIIAITSYAASFSISDVINQAENFSTTNTEIPLRDIKSLQKTVYNLLFTFGVIISVVGTAILGVQFITSAPEGKAEVKQRLIPFVIGCIIVFAGFAIWKFAVNVAQGI